MFRLYNVKDSYVEYLRNFEPKVLFNKQETRPYVGIVYIINNINYYVPLSSPKPKYLHMKNSKDFHKVSGGKYGAINFNKMIPVKDSELLKLILTMKLMMLIEAYYKINLENWLI